MSAFYSVTYPDCIQILTDGAAYEDDGTLTAVREKVWRSEHLPVAITTRGHMAAGEAAAKVLLDCIVRSPVRSVDFALVAFQKVFALLEDRDAELPGPFEVLIAAWSETDGPVQYYAATFAASGYSAVTPFQLVRAPDELCAGAATDIADDLARAGITPESMADSDGMERHGAEIFEALRRKPGPNPARPDLPEIYGVGGHVQLTTVTAAGARTVTLRTWPDRIGEKIDPFADHGNVVQLTRQQRRQLERQGRRHAAA